MHVLREQAQMLMQIKCFNVSQDIIVMEESRIRVKNHAPAALITQKDNLLRALLA